MCLLPAIIAIKKLSNLQASVFVPTNAMPVSMSIYCRLECSFRRDWVCCQVGPSGLDLGKHARPNIALRPKLLKLHINFSMFRRVVMKSDGDTFGKLLQ